MRILVSAYACEPGKGSEPGIGWSVSTGLSERHDVWVLTRSNNRTSIEADLALRPRPRLGVIYHDLPDWARSLKRGQRGVQLYYYLWQLSARRRVKAATREHAIQVCHHATFAKYWGPSAVAWSGLPYVMGPLGGADVVPPGLESVLGVSGRAFELARRVARTVGEADPLVRKTLRGAATCIGATPATTDRLRAMGAQRTATWNQVGVNPIDESAPPEPEPGRLRVACVGRLVPLKAVTLALDAIAAAPSAFLDIVGDGPERARLEKRCVDLGIVNRVRFLGEMTQQQALLVIKKSDALLHPSLHDSGGMVCAEALSLGRPVIALRWAGPAEIVDDSCGVLVNPFGGPQLVAGRIALAIEELAAEGTRTRMLGANGLARVDTELCWRCRIDRLEACIAASMEGTL